MVQETTIFGNTVDPRKWHPSIGFHLLRGEVLAYNYVMTILDSIYMLEADLKMKSPQELANSKIIDRFGWT